MTSGTAGGPGDDFRLPDVGEGLESAEIVEWLVHEGDTVARDQPLVEILTDKSQTQLPSPKAGVIKRLGVSEGDIAEVGQIIVEFEAAEFEAGDETSTVEPATTAERGADAGARNGGTVPKPGTVPADASTARRRPKAAPVVRRRALDAGIDLHDVAGTGPGDRITIADLDQFINDETGRVTGTPADPVPRSMAASSVSLGQMKVGRHPLRGIRRATARAMTTALDIPHIHGSDELDATPLLAGRRRIKELHPARAAALTPLAFFVMAVADGLRRYPMLNASITLDGSDGHIDIHDHVNVGIAVATEAGLIVPVIRDADQRSLFELADEIQTLTAAARDRTITAERLRGGTGTITNYGSLGGRFATPMIRPPEVSIVGFGSIRQRPFVVDGTVMARMTLPISVAVDHRLIDGDVMTAFQEHIIGLLSDPVALLAR